MKFKTILSYESVMEKLIAIPDLKHRAFLSLTYGSFARVGEITRHHLDKLANRSEWVNEPVSDTDLHEENGFLMVEILTEKTGLKRKVPICCTFEAWLTEPIQRYAQTRQGHLFPYSTRWGEKIFEKYFGEICRQHIHHLRAWRATHALQGKTNPDGNPLTPNIVARMGGWKDLKSLLTIYDQSVVEDYLPQLRPKKKEPVKMDILFGDEV